MKLSESYKKRLSELSGIKVGEPVEYVIVYRGQDEKYDDMLLSGPTWVSHDSEFAKEYGAVKKFKMPAGLEILNVDNYSTWEELVDEYESTLDEPFAADYDEYKYEPTTEFIQFLIRKGYEGFENGPNILIFNKSNLQEVD